MPIVTINDINAMNSDILGKDMWVRSLSAVDNVTAGTTQTQAGGTPITNMITRVVTVGSAGDAMRLPPAVAGLVLTVVNAHATNSMGVFPAVGDAVNALAANAVYAQAATKNVLFTCTAAGRWHTNPA